MSEIYTRNFDEPDEVIEVDKVRSEIISLGGVSLAHEYSAAWVALGGACRPPCGH